MNGRIAVLALLMVIAAAIGAGCTGKPAEATPTPTPAMTTMPPVTTPSPPPTPSDCLATGPTDTVDPRYEVAVDVIRDPITLHKEITVIFQGGKGQYLTSRVDVTVTREDCSTETRSITRPAVGESIIAGSEVTFVGSDRDRVQVTVTINGIPYKIIDKVFAQRTRP